MPDTSYEILTAFFREHLPFTPTSKQVEEFQVDLSLVSPYLMQAALIEVKEGRQGQLVNYRPDSWRSAIFKVYNRKVAEHAQLFCIFHCFETAYRSTVAVSLEQHYQHQRWWRKIYEEQRNGNNASSVRQIGRAPVARDTAFTIGNIIQAIDDERPGTVERLQNGYQFLECCNLGQVATLIERHWSLFGPRFVISRRALSRADFRAKFERIRAARNDVYHHKSVARTTGVVSTAEELLDYLNFSLRFVMEKIAEARVAKPAFSIPLSQERHHPWSD